MVKITSVMENYLEAVYELSRDGSGARVTDIANRMGVSKASVNNAMSVLAEKGLIENEPYQEIRMTPAGEEYARIVSGKHAIIERLLTVVLGVEPKIADVDACAIEHIISAESVQAMYSFLQQRGCDSLHNPVEHLNR